jgi:hypothetical protein
MPQPLNEQSPYLCNCCSGSNQTWHKLLLLLLHSGGWWWFYHLVPFLLSREKRLVADRCYPRKITQVNQNKSDLFQLKMFTF